MAGCAKGIYKRDQMKILFIEPYPIEGPSSRYRVEQYVPYFEDNGIECIVRPFVSSKFYNILYKKGLYFKKILFFFQSSLKRFFDIFTALSSDIIFIHLEVFPFGPPLFEWILFKAGKKIIYDLDDAIYMGITSPANRFLKCLKCPSKIKKIIRLSTHVITCNEYLSDYARRYNKNITIIHTSVDTEKFAPKIKDPKEDITIGWIGSHTTTPYIEELKDVFYKLSLTHRFSLKIIGAAEHNIKIPGIKIMNLDWSLKNEIEQFQSLDIGVYPLPENEWTLGKTGFKTIQYMSVGIPAVVSNSGANRTIVRDGISGFLAETEAEWIKKISRLIEDSGLRRSIGYTGRKIVEEKFSVKVNAPRLLEVIKRYESK